MPGGGTSQQVVNQPPAYLQPFLEKITNVASGLFDSKAGAATYGGPDIAPLSRDTRTGMDMIRGVANSGDALNMAQRPFDVMGSIAGGAGATSDSKYGGLFNEAAGMKDRIVGILGGIAGGNPITTESRYGNIYSDANTQNTVPNRIMGQIAGNRNGINTGNQYGAYARDARLQNDPFVNRLNDVSRSTYGGITTADDFAGVAGDAGGQTAADKYLTGMAAGGAGTGADDPYIKAIAEQNAERISRQLASIGSGRGRLGSAGVNDAIATQISNANNPLFAGAAEAARNRQLAASGQLDASRMGFRGQELAALQGQTGAEQATMSNKLNAATAGAGINQGDLGLALQALTGQTGVQGQNIADRLRAAGLLADSNRADTGLALAATQGLTGAQATEAGIRSNAAQAGAGINTADMGLRSGLLGQWDAGNRADDAMRLSAAGGQLGAIPMFQQLAERPGQLMAGIGGMQDARNQAQIEADRQRFNERDEAGWTQLQKLLGPVMAAVGGGGNTTTSTQNNPFGLQQGLGLGIAGIPALFGAPFGGTSAIGGIGGLLSGLFGNR
jgi:hypothetical protein